MGSGSVLLQQVGLTSSTAGSSYNATSFTNNSVMVSDKSADCEADKARVSSSAVISFQTCIVITRPKTQMIDFLAFVLQLPHTNHVQGLKETKHKIANVSRPLMKGKDFKLFYSVSVQRQGLDMMLSCQNMNTTLIMSLL